MRNKINETIYIGSTNRFKKRCYDHEQSLKSLKHSNSRLQNSWNKYGEENFVFEMIEKCDIADLHAREHYWVNEFNALDKSIGYNLKPTDPNGCSIHSEETKEKLRQANKGKKPHPNCYEAGKKYNHSELCKINLAKAREKLKNVDFYQVHSIKRKKIQNTITGEIYSSLRIASEILKIPKYELSRKLLGKRKNNTNLIYV
jgi:group I intron endonuclease